MKILNNSQPKKIKKREKIIILVLILFIIVGLIFLLSRPTGKTVLVKEDNKEISRFNLNQEITRTFELDGEINTVKISGGEVDVTSANCPNQICVNTAPIKNEGETIVCLPHHFIVEIV